MWLDKESLLAIIAVGYLFGFTRAHLRLRVNPVPLPWSVLVVVFSCARMTLYVAGVWLLVRVLFAAGFVTFGATLALAALVFYLVVLLDTRVQVDEMGWQAWQSQQARPRTDDTTRESPPPSTSPSVDLSAHYAVLGLGADADLHAVKEAYRTLALRHHPDHNADSEATAHMQRINAAYQAILNASRN